VSPQRPREHRAGRPGLRLEVDHELREVEDPTRLNIVFGDGNRVAPIDGLRILPSATRMAD